MHSGVWQNTRDFGRRSAHIFDKRHFEGIHGNRCTSDILKVVIHVFIQSPSPLRLILEQRHINHDVPSSSISSIRLNSLRLHYSFKRWHDRLHTWDPRNAHSRYMENSQFMKEQMLESRLSGIIGKTSMPLHLRIHKFLRLHLLTTSSSAW